ncbi:hypothetical protein PMI33_03406 [Pseudomonas sp. GM67]|nr:hypothetical protein PMI33_03406 [Pseudomonas sp. GM67]
MRTFCNLPKNFSTSCYRKYISIKNNTNRWFNPNRKKITTLHNFTNRTGKINQLSSNEKSPILNAKLNRTH